MAKVLIHEENDGDIHLTEGMFGPSKETLCGKKLHPISTVHTPKLAVTCAVCKSKCATWLSSIGEDEKETKKFYLDIMGGLLKQLNQIFLRFKEDCKHRNKAVCNHKDFHKDFALANICSLEECPIMEEEEPDL